MSSARIQLKDGAAAIADSSHFFLVPATKFWGLNSNNLLGFSSKIVSTSGWKSKSKAGYFWLDVVVVNC